MKKAKSFSLISDAISDYIREMYYPDSIEIDCSVQFDVNPERALVIVLAERKAVSAPNR